MEMPIYENNDISLNNSLYDDYQITQELDEHSQPLENENVIRNEESEVKFIFKFK